MSNKQTKKTRKGSVYMLKEDGRHIRAVENLRKIEEKRLSLIASGYKLKKTSFSATACKREGAIVDYEGIYGIGKAFIHPIINDNGDGFKRGKYNIIEYWIKP